LFVCFQAKNLELSEERAKYRELVIQTQLEKKPLKTMGAFERRILDFLTSSKREGLLRDAIEEALEEVRLKALEEVK